MREGPLKAEEITGISYRPRNLSEFSPEKKPEGMTDEVFMAKMREKYPGKTLAIYPDSSVGPVPERHFSSDDPQPRRGKTYAQYNPLWDSLEDLQRY